MKCPNFGIVFEVVLGITLPDMVQGNNLPQRPQDFQGSAWDKSNQP